MEIKSGMTFTTNWFDGREYWNTLAGNAPENGFVVYGGEDTARTRQGMLVGWREVEKVVNG